MRAHKSKFSVTFGGGGGGEGYTALSRPSAGGKFQILTFNFYSFLHLTEDKTAVVL